MLRSGLAVQRYDARPNPDTSTGSQAAVNVTLPAPGSTSSSPVHFVANAKTSCSKGVAAVGIYVNNGLVTTIPGSKLDTSISLKWRHREDGTSSHSEVHRGIQPREDFL